MLSRRTLAAFLVAASGLAAFAGNASDSPGAAAARSNAETARASARAALEADPTITESPSSILVRFAVETPREIRESYLLLGSADIIREYTLVPGLTQVAISTDVASAVAFFRGLPFVEYAEPDFVQHHTASPNDTYYGLQYALNNTGQSINGDPGTADADIDAAEAWDTLTGDANFIVAIIDTGAQWSHPDLSGNIWSNSGETAGNGIDDDGNGYIDDVRGWDFYNNDNNPDDTDGHGTHTSGTVGAVGNNSVGVAGVLWDCSLMPLRFIGPGGGYTSDAIEAVQYAANKNVRVSNNSWGGGGFSQALYDAISASKSVNHLFVCAAGNAGTNNDSSPFYPASYNLNNIIAVAATDNDDAKASFSNYGATSVDIGAPDVLIASTYMGSQYVYLDGTSMASPHVAGVAALVTIQNPGWTYTQVRDQLFSTARSVSSLTGKCVTGGVVNAAAALAGGTQNDAPTVTISSPSNGSSFTQGTSITFTGSASDTEDGDLSGSLSWSSSINGVIGSGSSFSTSSLSAGTHTITASVTDSGGKSGSKSISITVTAISKPAAPSSLTVTALGSGKGRLNWRDNSNNETGFEINRQKRVSGVWTATTSWTVGANTTTYTDSPGAGVYRYRIRAYNAGGYSGWTVWVQRTLN